VSRGSGRVSGANMTTKANKASDTKKKSATRLADARARMYHDLIFESAESVFGRKGYDGATMQDIADEAGVSLKTVYATYENKKDLYDQILVDRAGVFVSVMKAAADEASDPLARLTRIVEAYVAFLIDHEDWLRIHLRARVAWALRPSDESSARAWVAGRDLYVELMRDAIDQGVIFDGDPDEMSALVQSLMQVQIGRAIENEQKDVSEIAATMMMYIRRLLCPR
jgi:AcrR family transcriptional regulator